MTTGGFVPPVVLSRVYMPATALRRGLRLCIDIGLSRHLRSLPEMRIWPNEILEQEDVQPT